MCAFLEQGSARVGDTKTTGGKGTHALVGEDQDDFETRRCVGHLMVCDGLNKNDLRTNLITHQF